jgi:hypothetical protein
MHVNIVSDRLSKFEEIYRKSDELNQLIEERKRSFQDLIENKMLQECESIHQTDSLQEIKELETQAEKMRNKSDELRSESYHVSSENHSLIMELHREISQQQSEIGQFSLSSKSEADRQAYLIAKKRYQELVDEKDALSAKGAKQIQKLIQESEAFQHQADELKNKQIAISEDFKKKNAELFDQHLSLLKNWYQETLQKFDHYEKSSFALTEEKVLQPKDVTWVNFSWKKKVKSKAFPFYGKVAFLVDEGTYCAAEICPLVAAEYQDLRVQKEIRGIQYQNELYPRDVLVIGKTQGGAQGLEERVFNTPIGTFSLAYPLYDVYTFIHKKRIEGVGFSGIPVREPLPSDDGLDPEIVQAIEWGMEINSNSK